MSESTPDHIPTEEMPTTAAEMTTPETRCACGSVQFPRWMINTGYGLVATLAVVVGTFVLAPETAVAVTQYLPEEYQEVIFPKSESCSANLERLTAINPTFNQCCSSTASTSCCEAETLTVASSCCASKSACSEESAGTENSLAQFKDTLTASQPPMPPAIDF